MVYSVRCIVYNFWCIVYGVQCTNFGVQCRVYGVNFLLLHTLRVARIVVSRQS